MNTTDKNKLRAALGYIELGMLEEAAEEVSALSQESLNDFDALILRLELSQRSGQWEQAESIARKLTKLQPEEPDWSIALAYAARRAHSVEVAREILCDAAARFPKEAVIHFNLACYSCQLGEIPVARNYLRKAFALDRSYIVTALKDQDLKPIWAEIISPFPSPGNNLDS
jgi:Flp pilus assembly protein TadD